MIFLLPLISHIASRIFAKAAYLISCDRQVTGDINGEILGPSLSTTLANAKRYNKEFQDDYVSVEHLMLAFYSDQRFVSIWGSQRVIDQNKYSFVPHCISEHL